MWVCTEKKLNCSLCQGSHYGLDISYRSRCASGISSKLGTQINDLSVLQTHSLINKNQVSYPKKQLGTFHYILGISKKGMISQWECLHYGHSTKRGWASWINSCIDLAVPSRYKLVTYQPTYILQLHNQHSRRTLSHNAHNVQEHFKTSIAFS